GAGLVAGFLLGRCKAAGAANLSGVRRVPLLYASVAHPARRREPMRRALIPVVVVLALGSAAPAQTGGWRFHWTKGQVLTYRVEHASTATEVAGGQTNGFSSKLVLTKRWQVKDVDADGVATLEMSMTAMRHEITPPDGKAL